MNVPIPSRQKILDAALEVFAKFGYEGGSLHAIAAQVGLKTPSLYAHFPSKAELFSQVLAMALTNWEQQIQQTFAKRKQSDGLREGLSIILRELAAHLLGSSAYRFWAQVYTLPPPILSEAERQNLQAIDHLLITLLADFCAARLSTETAAAQLEIFCTSVAFFVFGAMSYGQLMSIETMYQLIDRGLSFHLEALLAGGKNA